jgi:hypothetical protein
MGLTTLPKVGNGEVLGPVKADAFLVEDATKQVKASEVNAERAALEAVCAEVGLANGTTPGSLVARTNTLESGIAGHMWATATQTFVNGVGAHLVFHASAVRGDSKAPIPAPASGLFTIVEPGDYECSMGGYLSTAGLSVAMIGYPYLTLRRGGVGIDFSGRIETARPGDGDYSFYISHVFFGLQAGDEIRFDMSQSSDANRDTYAEASYPSDNARAIVRRVGG